MLVFARGSSMNRMSESKGLGRQCDCFLSGSRRLLFGQTERDKAYATQHAVSMLFPVAATNMSPNSLLQLRTWRPSQH